MKSSFVCFLFILGFYSCAKERPNGPQVQKFKRDHKLMLEENERMSRQILNSNFTFHGLEVVNVEPGETYYSWFGHIFLRFVGSGNTPEQDLAVSFIGDFNDFELDITKAYFGGYRVLPVIKTFKDFVSDYTVKEERYMERFALAAGRDQRNNIKHTLRRWIKNPGLPGPYSFRRNSCVRLLLKLLASGIGPIDSDKNLFPAEVGQYLRGLNKVVFRFPRITSENWEATMKSKIQKELYQTE